LIADHSTDSQHLLDESRGTVSVAVAAGGRLHVAYFTAAVRHATERDGTWASEIVSQSSSFGFGLYAGWPSLALDRLGGVHMAWYQEVDETGRQTTGPVGRYAYLAAIGNGVDENCDGVDGVDADADGHASIETGGDDPDDADPTTP
jgi:hypothetical protein